MTRDTSPSRRFNMKLFSPTTTPRENNTTYLWWAVRTWHSSLAPGGPAHPSAHRSRAKHSLAMMRSLAQYALTKPCKAISPRWKTSCLSLVALRYSITVGGTLALGGVGPAHIACSAGHLRMLCELTEYRRLFSWAGTPTVRLGKGFEAKVSMFSISFFAFVFDVPPAFPAWPAFTPLPSAPRSAPAPLVFPASASADLASLDSVTTDSNEIRRAGPLYLKRHRGAHGIDDSDE